MPARRKPTALKELQGTARADRERKAVAATGTPKPSTWLDKASKKTFKHIVKTLAAQGTEFLAAIDWSVIELFSVAYTRWREAEIELARTGPVVQEPLTNRTTGNVVGYRSVPNTWAKIAKDRASQLSAAATKLGLEVSSRSRLALPEPVAKPTKSRTKQYAEMKPVREIDIVADLRAKGLL